MPAKVIHIRDLQPSDTLRPDATSFLESLSEEELQRLGLPQVWNIDGKLIISDGNQRTAIAAKKGKTIIQVDYQGKVPEYMNNFKEIVLNNVRLLQESGVNNPYDLWQT